MDDIADPMIADQEKSVALGPARTPIFAPRAWGGFWKPLVFVSACTFALLVGIYLLPFQLAQDIGSDKTSWSGLYAGEANPSFTYAYTNGKALFYLPKIGTGSFVVQLRMGGPHGADLITGHLATPTDRVDVGKLDAPRVFHVLVTTGADGDLRLLLQSTTTTSKSDPRQLGLLLDWVRVRPVTAVFAPPYLLLTISSVLLVLWLAVVQLPISHTWKTGALFLVASASAFGFAVTRGRVPIQEGLIAGSILFSVTISFSRFDEWSFGQGSRRISLLFVIWHLVLWLAAGAGLWHSASVYQVAKNRTLAGSIVDTSELTWKALAGRWMQFDSGHYEAIALHGYTFYNDPWPNIAFFPLYPLLIRVLLPLTGGNVTIAALLVSNTALFVALLLLYDLLAKDFNVTVAYRSLVFLLVFPTSFYFVAGYTESLALALIVAAVWAMRRKYWWLAGLCGALLALTRLPGVLMAPVIAVVYLQQHEWRWRTVRPAFLTVLLPPIGLALFMLFQWWRFGTPFAFMIAQRAWNNRLSPPWTIPSLLLTSIANSTDWSMRLFQLVVWVSFLVLTILGSRRLPLAYSLTMFLLLIPPYLSNYHGSFPRYVLIGFPAFVLMAMYTRASWLRPLIIMMMLLSLTIGVVLFVNGFWVA